jgi:hypothetical protein
VLEVVGVNGTADSLYSFNAMAFEGKFARRFLSAEALASAAIKLSSPTGFKSAFEAAPIPRWENYQRPAIGGEIPAKFSLGGKVTFGVTRTDISHTEGAQGFWAISFSLPEADGKYKRVFGLQYNKHNRNLHGGNFVLRDQNDPFVSWQWGKNNQEVTVTFTKEGYENWTKANFPTEMTQDGFTIRIVSDDSSTLSLIIPLALFGLVPLSQSWISKAFPALQAALQWISRPVIAVPVLATVFVGLFLPEIKQALSHPSVRRMHSNIRLKWAA